MATSLIGLIQIRRMWPITLAQSCGALNDNLVKNAMIVLSIFKLGQGSAGLSALAGALFIAPYVLLSATAGTLADRFPKPSLIRLYKVAEGALILPRSGPAIVGATGVAVSLIGLFAAMRLLNLRPADPGLALTCNIPAETWRVVRAAAAIRPVWVSVLGLSWFWTMGAMLMTVFPVIARDTMGADGTVLTLLLTVFAIGFGIGSIACAVLLKGRISARFVPLAALGISVFCWDFANAALVTRGVASAAMALSSWAGWRLLADLLLLAACGGLFSVPLYALMHEAAPAAQRSRIVAANNIMNALFMVLGSAAAAGMAAMSLDAPAVLRVGATANLLAAGWIMLALRQAGSAAEVLAPKPRQIAD